MAYTSTAPGIPVIIGGQSVFRLPSSFADMADGQMPGAVAGDLSVDTLGVVYECAVTDVSNSGLKASWAVWSAGGGGGGGGGAAPVTSVNDKTGDVTLDATNIDLAPAVGGYTNVQGAISGIVLELADLSTVYVPLAAVGVADGVVPLNALGKVDPSFLPPPPVIASEVVSVADAAARLALSTSTTNSRLAVQQDDDSLWYIAQNADPSVSGNWVQVSATAGIMSINGKTGSSVTLTAADIDCLAVLGATDVQTALNALKTAIDGVAAGGAVPATAVPAKVGAGGTLVGTVGTATEYARADHVHAREDRTTTTTVAGTYKSLLLDASVGGAPYVSTVNDLFTDRTLSGITKTGAVQEKTGSDWVVAGVFTNSVREYGAMSGATTITLPTFAALGVTGGYAVGISLNIKQPSSGTTNYVLTINPPAGVSIVWNGGSAPSPIVPVGADKQAFINFSYLPGQTSVIFASRDFAN